ncbi:hypothetical protein Pst134EA_011868 [Puccinia striiformis f. sp. tritici]|uniref:hypothetical protein n=1 Tax=Puccinia striiformis f. sp. tritici TaxID=168172 RepID=UPI00200890A9|nr:hypothetical protein Pst134EA_011868 [Puccinia striiformis f. sp. tritici]KAH9468242.1 hypothetical protein Pst134EA_011868 [Puccinia striiformis f. sp. tritici]
MITFIQTRQTNRVEKLMRLRLSDKKFVHQAIISGANFGPTRRGQVDILLVSCATVEGGDKPTNASSASLHFPEEQISNSRQLAACTGLTFEDCLDRGYQSSQLGSGDWHSILRY